MHEDELSRFRAAGSGMATSQVYQVDCAEHLRVSEDLFGALRTDPTFAVVARGV